MPRSDLVDLWCPPPLAEFREWSLVQCIVERFLIVWVLAECFIIDIEIGGQGNRIQQSARELEEFVADLWEVQGWEARATQGSQDMGVDVLATKSDGPFEQSLAIQAKCYSQTNPVGQKEIKEYYSLRDQERVDAVVIVTTSRFTSGAVEWANEYNLKLVDGDDLLELVKESDCWHLVDTYLPESSVEKSRSVGGSSVVETGHEPDSDPSGPTARARGGATLHASGLATGTPPTPLMSALLADGAAPPRWGCPRPAVARAGRSAGQRAGRSDHDWPAAAGPALCRPPAAGGWR